MDEYDTEDFEPALSNAEIGEMMDSVQTDTVRASYEDLDELVSMLGGEGTVTAKRVVIETETSELEFTGRGDSVELREID